VGEKGKVSWKERERREENRTPPPTPVLAFIKDSRYEIRNKTRLHTPHIHMRKGN
jgi:hypothetical protein